MVGNRRVMFKVVICAPLPNGRMSRMSDPFSADHGLTTWSLMASREFRMVSPFL